MFYREEPQASERPSNQPQITQLMQRLNWGLLTCTGLLSSSSSVFVGPDAVADSHKVPLVEPEASLQQ